MRICRDLSVFGEAVTIAVVKNSVTFKSTGDMGDGSITLLETTSDKEDENVRIFYYITILFVFILFPDKPTKHQIYLTNIYLFFAQIHKIVY